MRGPVLPTVNQCAIPGTKAQIIFRNQKPGAGGRKSEACPDISHFFRLLSLTPGFSPVETGEDGHSRFNGFPQCVKAAEAAPSSLCPQNTGLKPGVNETAMKFAGQKPKERTLFLNFISFWFMSIIALNLHLLRFSSCSTDLQVLF